MEVSNVRAWTDKTDNGTPIVQPGEETSKDIFLQMLVGQMTNQDPFNTQDPTQYITQLAQFSTLEQMMSINDGIEYLASINNGVLVNSALETASSLIGKEVELCVPDDEGETINYSGMLKSVSIKDGSVYLEVEIGDSGEVKEFSYSSLVKVKEN